MAHPTSVVFVADVMRAGEDAEGCPVGARGGPWSTLGSSMHSDVGGPLGYRLWL